MAFSSRDRNARRWNLPSSGARRSVLSTASSDKLKKRLFSGSRGSPQAIYPALASNSRTQPIARKQYSSGRRPPPRVPQVVDHNSLHMQNGEEGHMFEYVDHNPTTGLSLNDLANNDIGIHAFQAIILIP